MKILDKHFYILYNCYYKDGSYSSDMPNLTVFGILLVAYWGLISFFVGCIYLAFDPYANHAPPLLYYVPLSILLVYFMFFRNRRYTKIYNTYKDCSNLNGKRLKILAFGVAILSILAFPILAFLRNIILL